MRRFLSSTLLLLAVGALVSPLVQADHPEGGDDGLLHLTVNVQDLEPGASDTYDMVSEEGPVRAGWIYILYGGVVQGEGHIVVNLTTDNGTQDRFVWENGFHKNSTKVAETALHRLVLWNPTNETLRYVFYYDQSCNCAGKQIPLPGGFVLFNHDFPAGREVDYELFVYEERFRLEAKLATYDKSQTTAHWPEDFEVLDEQTVQGKEWIRFSFTPSETRTYYVFFEALEGATPDDPVVLTPVIDVASAEEGSAPGPGLLGLALLVSFVAVILRRRPSP